MKRLDLRKYIFPYVAVALVFLIIYLHISYALQPHLPINSNDLMSDAFILGLEVFYCVVGIVFALAITLIEILVRKYIIKKYFPDFKLNLNIKLPKFITIILSIIFYIGFVIAVLLGVLLLFLVFPYDAFT